MHAKDDKPLAPSAGLAPDAMRNLVLICIGVTGVLVSESMLLLAVPLRALELGASPSFVGVIMSAPYLLPLLFAIPIGGMVYRLGSKRVMQAGALGMMAGPWLSLAFPTVSGLIATQAIIGLAQIVTVIASQSLVTGLGRGRTLERYFGWYSMCLSGGQLIGPLLAGKMIDTLPMTWVFAAIGAIPMIGLIAFFLLVDSTHQTKPSLSSLSGYRAQASLLRQNVGIQISILTTIVTLFALGAHSAFLPLYLEQLAFSATVIGGLVSLRALASMVIRLFMAQIVQFLKGRSSTLITSAAGIAMGIMWTGTTDSIIALSFLAVLVGFGAGITQPLTIIIIAEHVRHEQRSSALGMRLMGNRGAQIVAPLILGLLAELVGFTWAFFIAGASLLIVMALVIRLIPAFDKAEAVIQLQQ